MKKLVDYIVEAEQHLAEQAEQQRLTKLAEIFGKENIKHGVAEAPVAKQYVAAKFIDEFGDGDHWYVKGTPELVQKFVMLANNIEQASMQGTEYEPGQGTMGQIHGQLGNDQSPQWKIVPAKNLDDIKPINNSVINVLSRVNLDEPGDEFMSDFLWRLEEKGLAKTVEDWDQQGVAEGNLRELAPNPGGGGGGGGDEGDDGFELPLDFKGRNIMVWPKNKKHSMGDTATPFPRGERFTGKVYIMWDQPKIEAIWYLDPKDREDREKEYKRVYEPRGWEDYLDHKWYDTTGVRYRLVTDWRLIPAKEPGGWPGIVDAWGQDMKGEVMNYPESFITEIIQKDGDGRHFVEPRQSVAEGQLNEFAPGDGSGEGRWYTDDQMIDMVGPDWAPEDDEGHLTLGQRLQDAQAWLDDQGYSVIVEDVQIDPEGGYRWKIYGEFYNPRFASKDKMNESSQQGLQEAWSLKYKRSINCSHPRGFSQKAHCAGRKKHNESVEMEMTCPDCGMCETHGDHTVAENFDDGKNPGRKGLSRRVGIPKKATLGQLEKIAKSSTGERRRMAQWQLNMRRGRNRAK